MKYLFEAWERRYLADGFFLKVKAQNDFAPDIGHFISVLSFEVEVFDVGEMHEAYSEDKIAAICSDDPNLDEILSIAGISLEDHDE